MVKIFITSATLLFAAVSSTSTFASSNFTIDCPERFYPGDIALTDIEKGGLFYFDQIEDRWVPVVSELNAVQGRNIEFRFVFHGNTCGEGPCPNFGYILVKTFKPKSSQSAQNVYIGHGDRYARISNFQETPTLNDFYQSFHTEGDSASNWIKRDWHAGFIPEAREINESTTTYRPLDKKINFAFSNEHLANGWRKARILRFEVPPESKYVCVKFDVLWNNRIDKVYIETMLIEPVFKKEDWNPIQMMATSN